MSDPAWRGEDYAGAAAHHHSFDDWFLAQHPPQAADRIVDAGCGSGEFSARLAELVPDGRVIGVDPDPSMLAAARRHHLANLELRQGGLQDLPSVCEPGWADLVVSRAAFHWIPLADYPRCYEAVREVLRPGGWFHAESGGGGNVAGLRAVLDDIAAGLGRRPAAVSFPDAGTVLEMLEAAGFEIPPSGVTTVAQRRTFDRVHLLDLVRTQASVAYGIGPADELLDDFVAATERRLDDLRRHDGTYDQSFVRLHVRCRRPADAGGSRRAVEGGSTSQ